MDLKDLVNDETELVSGWVTFCDGFDLELEYIGKRQLREIIQGCTKTVYRAHQPIQETDEAKLRNKLAGFIKDWRGLDEKTLRRLFPLKDGISLNGDQVPCTEPNKLFMLENCYNFEDFLVKNLTEIEALQRQKLEAELKNSGALSPEG